jgi:hypothetical protein
MTKLTSLPFAASIAIAALLAAPAWADDPQQPQGQQPPAAASNAPPAGAPEEMVCKVRSEPAIGSKINKRIKICRTQREWDEEKRIGQNTAQSVQKSGGGQSGLLQMGPAGKGQPKGAN